MSGLRILLVIIVISTFVASCVSLHSGQVASVSASNISDKDVVFKDVVFGYSHAHYFLGFGGNEKSLLTADALENLYSTKLLENGEYFDNVTYNTKFTFFPFFYWHKEVLVVAHLMQSDTLASRTYTKDFLNQINTNQQHNDFGFIPNEKVLIMYNNAYYHGKVVDSKKTNLRVAFKTSSGFYRVVKSQNKNAFKEDPVIINDLYSVGDTIAVRNSYNEIIKGRIIGYNRELVLTRSLTDGLVLTISQLDLQ